MIRRFLFALTFFLLLPLSAKAATCFWVTGTAWNNSANWSATTGPGGGGTCAATSGIPKNAGDIAKLDANSPAATTLTVDIDFNIAQIDISAATGGTSIDFNGHTIGLSTSFVASGSGTRSITCGAATINLTGANATIWDTSGTNITLSCASSTINISNQSGTVFATFKIAGSQTYGTVNFGSFSGAGCVTWTVLSGTGTITTLGITSPTCVGLSNGATYVVTNAVTWSGTSATSAILIESSNAAATATLNVATGSTCAWCALKNIVFTGSAGAFTATNSFNLGGNTLNSGSITGPTGGGGFIIGGG